MGHAPPRSNGELRRRAERQQRRRDLIGRVPPGTLGQTAAWGLWTGVLIAGVLWGSPTLVVEQLIATLVFIVVLTAFYWRRKYLASPEAAQGWFERELWRIPPEVDVQDKLPGLELELDYRLGLKQRLAPAGRSAPEGERPSARGVRQARPPAHGVRLFEPDIPRPTQPPPKPPDVIAYPANVVFLGPGEQILRREPRYEVRERHDYPPLNSHGEPSPENPDAPVVDW